LAAEKGEEFCRHQTGHEKRAAGAAKAAATKQKNMIDWANSLEITVPVLPWNQLVRATCASYNNHRLEKEFTRRFY